MSSRLEMAMVVLVLAATACGGAEGADGGGPAQAGVLKGMASDSRGQPLQGARIQACNPLYEFSCLDRQTGADGRYSIDLPGGNAWKVNGYITKTYNGKPFCMDLHPDAMGTFGSHEGAVRNFSWKLSGLRPDATEKGKFQYYYGASVSLGNVDYNQQIAYRYVQMTFVPDGPLVDGSAGQAFTSNAGDWVWSQIGDIPLGRYTVSAVYAPPEGGRIQLLLSTSRDEAPAPSAVFDFDTPPGGTCSVPEKKIYLAFAG